MKKNLFVFFVSVFFCIDLSFAEDRNTQEFDYIRGKIEGRATVSGGWVQFHITGSVAESIYYQLPIPSEKDIGCTGGETKARDGLMCTKIVHSPDSANNDYECFLDINLKSGKLNNHTEVCPEKEQDVEWDARGNRQPRSLGSPES
jgi:hypothetical protein